VEEIGEARSMVEGDDEPISLCRNLGPHLTYHVEARLKRHRAMIYNSEGVLAAA
jgi:hypothetical protein